MTPKETPMRIPADPKLVSSIRVHAKSDDAVRAIAAHMDLVIEEVRFDGKRWLSGERYVVGTDWSNGVRVLVTGPHHADATITPDGPVIEIATATEET